MRKITSKWRQSFQSMKNGETVECPVSKYGTVRATAYMLNIENTDKRVWSVTTDRPNKKLYVSVRKADK